MLTKYKFNDRIFTVLNYKSLRLTDNVDTQWNRGLRNFADRLGTLVFLWNKCALFIFFRRYMLCLKRSV